MVTFSRCLKWVATVMWVLCATLALALPMPKDIEAAVAAGHYTQAETMVREVLQEKPQSAKAHYELGQILAHQRRYKEAQTELEKAKSIDPSLKFATSPEKFNQVFATVANQVTALGSSVVMEPTVASTAPTTQTARHAAPESVSGSGGFPMGYVWLGIGGLVVLGLWLRRSAALKANATNLSSAPMTMGSAVASRGFGSSFNPNAPQPVYGAQTSAQPRPAGSSMTGAVLGGVAGLAAGYALSKAMEGGHHASTSASADTPASNPGGYVPFDTPAQSPDVGAFDAGSGSDWEQADSGEGGDDSW